MAFKIADGYVEIHAEPDRASARRSAKTVADEAESIGRSNSGNFWRWLFKVDPGLMRLIEAPLGAIFGSPVMFAGAAALAGILSGVLSAALSSAILLGVGGGLIAAGAFALRKNEELKKTWKSGLEEINKSMSRAAQPLLKPLMDGINYFVSRFKGLEPSFKRLFGLTGGLIKPSVDILMGLIQGMLPGLERAMPGIQTIFDTLAKHMPGLGTAIGDFIATIASNGPLIERVMGLLITWLEIFFKVLGPVLLEGMRSFAVAADMWNAFTDAVVKGVNWIGDTWGKIPGWWDASWGAVSGFFKDLWKDISGFFTNLGSGSSDAWKSTTESIKTTWQGVLDWFGALPGKIQGFVASIPGHIGQAFITAFDNIFYIIGFGFGLIVQAFTNLPSTIWNVTQTGLALVIGLFTAAGSAMVENVKTSFNWIKETVTGAFNWMTNFVQRAWAQTILNTSNAVKSVVTFIALLPANLYKFAREAWSKLMTAFVNGGINAVNFAKALPGRILNAISSLKGSMGNAGKDAIRGLVNGIESMMGWAVDIARRAAGRIADGFKDALGIGSPSKVFADEVGRWIPAGIMMGVEKNMGAFDKFSAGLPDLLTGQRSLAPNPAPAPAPAGNTWNVSMTVEVSRLQELADVQAFLDGRLRDTSKSNTWAGNIYEAQGQYERSYR